MRRSTTLTILALATLLSMTAGARAATSGNVEDPVGDVTQFAADLGATQVTVNDDDTITVNTAIVPRPPAGWGGCAYTIGFFPFETCVPANMTVTWFLDHTANAGSVAEQGADAKVVAIPSRGKTTWESTQWDAANGKFKAGAVPAFSEDANGVHWTLRLGDLGIPRPATIQMRIVSLYTSYTGTGILLDYNDTAGPAPIPVAAPPIVGSLSADCTKAVTKANNLTRKIRRAKRKAKNGSAKAKRRLKRLRKRRKAAGKRVSGLCGNPVPSVQQQTSAPPGCHLVTKPVLVQDGPTIYAPFVFREQVVVECSK